MSKKKAETVLIVGDNPGIKDIAAKQKSLSGCRSIMASNVAEALQVASKQPQIDILLTEIMPPDRNGEDLAKQFIKLYPKARILYMIP